MSIKSHAALIKTIDIIAQYYSQKQDTRFIILLTDIYEMLKSKKMIHQANYVQAKMYIICEPYSRGYFESKTKRLKLSKDGKSDI